MPTIWCRSLALVNGKFHCHEKSEPYMISLSSVLQGLSKSGWPLPLLSIRNPVPEEGFMNRCV